MYQALVTFFPVLAKQLSLGSLPHPTSMNIVFLAGSPNILWEILSRLQGKCGDKQGMRNFLKS